MLSSKTNTVSSESQTRDVNLIQVAMGQNLAEALFDIGKWQKIDPKLEKIRKHLKKNRKKDEVSNHYLIDDNSILYRKLEENTKSRYFQMRSLTMW